MYRLAIMMRGCLVPCIYRKTLSLNSSDATASAALTLISTDIEVIKNGLVQLHEVWASFVEIGLAIYLLEKQVGWAAAVSISFAVGKYLISLPLFMSLLVNCCSWYGCDRLSVRFLGSSTSGMECGIPEKSIQNRCDYRQHQMDQAVWSH